MAYNAELADRLFDAVAQESGMVSRKMFGGLALMWNGNMLCGVMGDDLMVRVGPQRYDALLQEPGAAPMDFTGRPMKGMIIVSGSVLVTAEQLEVWVQRARDFVGALPPK